LKSKTGGYAKFSAILKFLFKAPALTKSFYAAPYIGDGM